MPDFPLEDFVPPPERLLRRLMAPSRWYFSPQISGTEHVNPARPALFVGNHALFGIIDSPLFVSALYRQTGVYPRSLGDHFHFRTPGWGRLLTHFGAVPGTRENCHALMAARQHVLVFPGGAREVAKRRDEINRLVWKKRTGFAYMAISHGYDIIPFASVGCDEAFDILYDGNDFTASRLGRSLLRLPRARQALRNGDLFMPWVKGLGPLPLPRPEPFHFRIGAPIATDAAPWAGRQDETQVLWDLREQVAGTIEGMISDLARDRDVARPQMSRWRRWLT
ncbi:acyltransferase family protein [Alcanivorax sp. JB21]|uniref:lysophospholipid acyltransferase family protein n=1 Tax=Alcanivorax limicola TaxID=2874102 RepID=UPI001CBB37DC|nr:lysophospholipid acyltransferase family protein [Alcanivorax limicola]MBZ2187914.1 acyltransferase family protein [Alcanivorax limicola]